MNANFDTLANHVRELDRDSLKLIHHCLLGWVGFVELLVEFEDIPQPTWLGELASYRDLAAEALELYPEDLDT